MDALSILSVCFYQNLKKKKKIQHEDANSFGSVIIQEEYQQYVYGYTNAAAAFTSVAR